jgi:hypothetical protein
MPTETPTATLVVGPGADAWVGEAAPTVNFGGQPRLFVDGDAGARAEGYLRFAVTGVDGAVVRATLRLHTTTASWAVSSGGPAVAAAGSDWTEAGITWADRPAPIGPAGADAGPVKANAWVEYDVTSLVDGDGAYTFVLVPTSLDGVEFWSREGAAPPQLVLTVDRTGPTGVPASTDTPAPTATATGTPEPFAGFQDGFESGDLSNWTRAGGLQVLPQDAHGGTYAARATSAGAGDPTYARKTLSTPQTELYYRTMVKIISQSDDSVYLLRFGDPAGSSILGLYVTGSGRLGYRNDVTDAATTSDATVGQGTWHEIEVHLAVDRSGGLVEVWLDGTRVLSDPEGFGTAPVGFVQLGDNGTGPRSYDIAFDDVAVATTPIPLGPPPTPTETPTPLPTPTDTPTDTPTATPSPTTLAFAPEADAYVSNTSGTAGTNFGTATSLVVDASPPTEGYLRFAVGGGTGAVVGARLRLYVRDAADDGPAVYAAGNDWTETGVTWNTRPARVGVAVANAGALALDTFVEYDVTALVRHVGTYTFALVPESTDPVQFTAKESTAASQRPQLVVTFDPTAPETTIDSSPPNTSNSASATFTFSTNQPNATFQCTIDGSAFADCTSPQQYTGLADGSHTFQVRATNGAGVSDPSPDSYGWTVDATAPTISSVSPANGATGVAVGSDVLASFSEPMDPATLTTATFTLVAQADGAPVAAAVTFDDQTDQAVLNPNADLTPGATYTATLQGGATGAKDPFGNPLSADRVWSFTIGAPVVTTLGPDADAKVESAAPTANYGILTNLQVDSSPQIESFLRFTVAGFGNGVTNAKLRLWITDPTSHGPAVYAAGNDWTETGITWDTKPARTAAAGDVKGAIAAGTWVEYDVTSLVTGDGTYTFDLVGAAADSASFSSREATAAERPQLVVTYDPTVAVVNVSASPRGGIYTSAQTVTLTSSVPNATIWYTTDTTDPRPGQPSHVQHKYLAPLAIPVDTPLRFVAVAPDGTMSAVFTEVYTIDNAAGGVGISYNGTSITEPAGDKPESKLWFNDGFWWGSLYNVSAGEYRIYRFDLGTQSWVDTGTTIDTREDSRADVLWDGTKLYVTTGTTVVSEWGNPASADAVAAGSAQLLRFSYDSSTKTYSLDPGFPVTIRTGSAESMTLARDSTGRLWTTFTLVTYDGGATPVTQVWVNHSLGSDTQWGTPFVPSISGTTASYDDVSSIVAFGGNKIGLMWSNQTDKKFYFSVHNDGDPDTAWQPTEVAYGGGVGGCSSGCANDHLNLKADSSGRVFAGVKTANRNTGQPFIVLLVRGTGGGWTPFVFGKVEDEHSRPSVVIDEQHGVIYLFATIREVGGAIFYKTMPLDLSQGFPPGPGTAIIQNPGDHFVNDATSTKQNVDSSTGLLIVANDSSSKHYLHGYLSLAPDPAPTPTSTATTLPTDRPTETPSDIPTATAPNTPTATPTDTPSPVPTATETPTSVPDAAVLLAAGDVASCTSSGDEATAKLLDGLPGTVLALGDLAYENGTAAEFAACYDPTWGRQKARTRPVPGNHDYHTSGAAGYFAYFGAAAGAPGEGWYSFDVGSWHLIALNSNCAEVGGCGAGSAQERWLRADLAAHPSDCTLAYWHHARFSSGTEHGSDPRTQALWQALYDAGADVVLVGHDHDYERFAPMDAAGRADPRAGIREFVVGTGGNTLYAFGPPQPNSEVRDDSARGVLQLTLRPGGFEWIFVPEAGKTFADAGSGACHGAPPAATAAPLAAAAGSTYVDNRRFDVLRSEEPQRWIGRSERSGVTRDRVDQIDTAFSAGADGFTGRRPPRRAAGRPDAPAPPAAPAAARKPPLPTTAPVLPPPPARRSAGGRRRPRSRRPRPGRGRPRAPCASGSRRSWAALPAPPRDASTTC